MMPVSVVETGIIIHFETCFDPHNIFELNLGRAMQALRETGRQIDDALLQYLSPLGWEHIILTGDYVWQQNRKLEDVQFRPLRIIGKP